MFKENALTEKQGEKYKDLFCKPLTVPKHVHEIIKSCSVVEYERYGGDGVGVHGGGARSANINGFQVKGVGLTPLAGKSMNINYSHGTLTLKEAALEQMYFRILNIILPLGAVNCYGYYFTGKLEAYSFSIKYNKTASTDLKNLEKAPGAILVREICDRPAHLFRSPFFFPRDEHAKEITLDSLRVKCVMSEYSRSHLNVQSFIDEICKFLNDCAIQFSFARVAGIFHGAISPSNISADARWVDLSSASIVEPERNYVANGYPFFDESLQIEPIVEEWIYMYEKFNSCTIDTSKVLNFYRDKLIEAKRKYSKFPFGIEDETDVKKCIESAFGESLFDIFNAHFNTKRHYGYERLADGGDSPILKVWDNVIMKTPQYLEDRKSYDKLVMCMIRSVKRMVLSGALRRTSIERNILKLTDVFSPDLHRDLSERYRDLAGWIYLNSSDHYEVLWKTASFTLVYSAFESKIVKITKSGKRKNIADEKRLDRFFDSKNELIDSCCHKKYKESIIYLLKGWVCKNGIRII